MIVIAASATDRIAPSKRATHSVFFQFDRAVNEPVSNILEDAFVRRSGDRTGAGFYEVPIALHVSNEIRSDQTRLEGSGDLRRHCP